MEGMNPLSAVKRWLGIGGSLPPETPIPEDAKIHSGLDHDEFSRGLAHINSYEYGSYYPFRSRTGWVLMSDHVYHSLLSQVSDLQDSLVRQGSLLRDTTLTVGVERRRG